MQPYLLTVNLGLPAHLQGRTVSGLNFANELLALCLVAPFGALADKIGRRAVYAFGFLWLAAGFLLYPTARTLPQLTGLRAVLLGRRRRRRHHVRNGAGRYRRRKLARAAGRSRGILPGPGRRRAGAVARPEPQAAGGFRSGRAHGRPHHVVDRGRAVRGVGGGGVRRTQARKPSERAPAMPLQAHPGGRRRGSATQSAHLVRLPAAVRLVRRSGGARHISHVASATGLGRARISAWPMPSSARGCRSSRRWWRGSSRRSSSACCSIAWTGCASAWPRWRSAALAYLLCGFVDDPTQGLLIRPSPCCSAWGRSRPSSPARRCSDRKRRATCAARCSGSRESAPRREFCSPTAFGGWLYDSVSKGGPFFLLAGVNFAIFLFGPARSI